MRFKKSIVSLVVFSSFIGFSTFLPTEKKAFAAKVNCASPVHKKKEICKEKLAKNPTFI